MSRSNKPNNLFPHLNNEENSGNEEKQFDNDLFNEQFSGYQNDDHYEINQDLDIDEDRYKENDRYEEGQIQKNILDKFNNGFFGQFKESLNKFRYIDDEDTLNDKSFNDRRKMFFTFVFAAAFIFLIIIIFLL